MQLKNNAIKFLHTSCFSPTTATWTKAINQDFFRSIPILTATNLLHNLPKSMATTMGHFDQQLVLHQKEVLPKGEGSGQLRGWQVYQPDCWRNNQRNVRNPSKESSTSWSDTPTTPTPFWPNQSRSDANQLKAYQVILKQVGDSTSLTMHWMNNEVSVAIKKQLTNDFKLDYQLVPLRCITAKQAIQTFKNHFFAGLCSADSTLPLWLWDWLLPQAEITINLMCASRTLLEISTYKDVFGLFDH
jgi:hypothetical protein